MNVGRALNSAAQGAARTLIAEIREFVKCARATHPNYVDAEQGTMDFRKSDLDAAIELETPTLKAGTSGSFRDTLSHTLDVVKSTADKYTSSRRSLVRYRKDHPTQAHLVVQVGEENADLLERSMAAMITALGAYIADESLPSEHDSVPEFRQLDSAET